MAQVCILCGKPIPDEFHPLCESCMDDVQNLSDEYLKSTTAEYTTNKFWNDYNSCRNQIWLNAKHRKPQDLNLNLKKLAAIAYGAYRQLDYLSPIREIENEIPKIIACEHNLSSATKELNSTSSDSHESNNVIHAQIQDDREDGIPIGYDSYDGNCLLCGEPTDGYIFCTDCYYKYKNKTVTLKLRKCESVKIMSADYEGNLRCTDGHVVKSKSEKFIDEYLNNHGIAHAYEATTYVDGIKLHPDFYLTDKKVYIEHWGCDDPYYLQTMYEKLMHYKADHKTLICTYESDMMDIEAELGYKLSHYKDGEINFLKDPEDE